MKREGSDLSVCDYVTCCVCVDAFICGRWTDLFTYPLIKINSYLIGTFAWLASLSVG